MNGDTMWETIAAHYRGQIDRGELHPGDALPGENQVAKSFGVARMTARRALQDLERTGRVTTGYRRTVIRPEPVVVHLARDPGQTWAGEAPTPGADAWGADMATAGREPTQDIEVILGRASPLVAARLEVPEGAPVVVRKLARHAAGRPDNLITFYFPADLASGTPLAGPDSIEQGALAWLEQRHGPLKHDPPEVSDRMPEITERTALRLPDGTPVLVVWRTSRAGTTPVVASMAVYRGGGWTILIP